MNVRTGWAGVIGATLVVVATARGGFADEAPAASAGAQLRWTPHRVATTAPAESRPLADAPRSPAESATPTQAAPMPPAPMPPAPPPLRPATVALPPDAGAPNFAPLRQNVSALFGGWTSTNRLTGGLQTSTPGDPDSILGVPVFRAPQGNRGRPILAPEGLPSRGTPRSSLAMAPPFDGSAATRSPAATAGARPGRDRIAMNVDGIPSVMAREAQSAAVGDSAAPGRLPAAAQPPAAETLPGPAPSTAGPKAALDPRGGPSIETTGPLTIDGTFEPSFADPAPDAGMWMGQYPAQVHVESFYDDPYACEDGEDGCLPLAIHDGRICAWLRRFGRPYYGWRWYRDFTASAGVTSFTNPTDLGLNGNYGTNEYLNWAMPFWNAFGVGWQIGVRGVQTNFQPATLTVNGSTFSKNARDQVFVTTGFFTRAFEGRGLQGGAAYDYFRDSWFSDVNVAQIRSELSYVWGYHEIGYWGANNVSQQSAVYTSGRTARIPTTTLDLYTAFYRLHFGDANEWRVWGGASGNGDGLVGSSLRAPMSRTFALEGTFTYLIPKQTERTLLTNAGTSISYGPSAWNVSVNLVYYPAGRSRRSLASPYRPLFDVADNGSMIRTLLLP